MPDTWTTVAAAAAALDVHPRTIERRLAAGKIQNRRSESGQVEVLVDLPDPTAPASDPFAVVADQATAQVQLATAASSALVQQSRMQTDRAYAELSLARQDAGRARRSAGYAWCVVAAMAGGTCAAVGWTTHKLTAASADVRQMDDRVRRAEDGADRVETEKATLSAERDDLRAQLVSAKVAQANAEGRASTMTAMSPLPTTRPSTLIRRLSLAFGGD